MACSSARGGLRDLLDAPQAQEVKRDPTLKLAFLRGIATFFLDFFDQWYPKSPWADRLRPARGQPRHRPHGALGRGDLGASRRWAFVPRRFEFAAAGGAARLRPCASEAAAGRGGYPTGSTSASSISCRRTSRWRGDRRVSRAAVGSASACGRWSARLLFAAVSSKSCVASASAPARSTGNAASRISELIPSDGAYAYGAIPTSTRCTSSRRARSIAPSASAAAPDPAACVRARAHRADLRIKSGRAASAPRRGARAHVDRSVHRGGAPGRGPTEEEDTMTLRTVTRLAFGLLAALLRRRLGVRGSGQEAEDRGDSTTTAGPLAGGGSDLHALVAKIMIDHF